MSQLFHEVPTYTVSLRPGPLLMLAERTCGASPAVMRIALAWYRENMPAAEHVILIGVNGKNNVCGLVEIGRGGAHGCALTPSDIFRAALAMSAHAIVLSHNHPSGDATPSVQDIVMTRAIAEAGLMLGIQLLDHVVVATPTGEAVSIFEHMGEDSPVRA